MPRWIIGALHMALLVAIMFSSIRVSPISINNIYAIQYRTPITITERSGNTLTNYQVRIELNSSNWDGWSYVSDNGSDIYFLDSNGDPLYYWIEYFNKTEQNATIWVNVSSIPSLSSTTIYMYYGGNNPYSTYNNPDKTFIFWDDFLGTSLNASKWNEYNYGSILVNNSILMLQGDSGGASKTHVGSIPSFSGDIEIRVRANVGTDLAYQALFILFYASSGSVFAYANSIGQGYAMRVSSEYYANDMQLYLFSDNTYTVLYTSDDSINTYQYNDYIIRIYEDTIYVWVNDIEYFNVTDTTYRDGCVVLEAYGSTGYRYFDYVIIRNYVKPEPTVSIGGSEVVGIPIYQVVHLSNVGPVYGLFFVNDYAVFSVDIIYNVVNITNLVVRIVDHNGVVRGEDMVSVSSNGSVSLAIPVYIVDNDYGVHTWCIQLYNESTLIESREVVVNVGREMPIEPTGFFVVVTLLSLGGVGVILYIIMFFHRISYRLAWKLTLASGLVLLILVYIAYTFYFVVPTRIIERSIVYSGSTYDTVKMVKYGPNPYILWLWLPTAIALLLLGITIYLFLWYLGRESWTYVEEFIEKIEGS